MFDCEGVNLCLYVSSEESRSIGRQVPTDRQKMHLKDLQQQHTGNVQQWEEDLVTSQALHLVFLE